MGLTTPLYDDHRRLGARLVDFAGWDMPLHYGSQIEEHHAVRRDAGMFDVSHMLTVDLAGPGAREFLRRVLANDVAKLATPGKALYSCMLNPEGGVIDDLIAYFFSEERFRLVVNAGTAEKDVAWLREQAEAFSGSVTLGPRRDLAMIAVQGPAALARLREGRPALGARAIELKPFTALFDGETMVARTGYTGEDGVEVIAPAEAARSLWRDLEARGVRPAGLGARDTLRLEAGMNLYGQDMDGNTSPIESGLAWTIAMTPGRDFVGRRALEAARPTRHMLGLVLEDKGVLRAHQKVLAPPGEGEITSGSFSPTMGRSIALARLPIAVTAGDRVEVDIRSRALEARVVKPPFVRHGRILV